MKISRQLKEYRDHLKAIHPDVPDLKAKLLSSRFVTYPTGKQGQVAILELSGTGYRTMRVFLHVEIDGSFYVI